MRLAAQIEHLNYGTAGYSKSARDLHADEMPRTADGTWRESAEWDIN